MELQFAIAVTRAIVSIQPKPGAIFLVASPPADCPMHKADTGPAHQDRAYEFVGCPMKAEAGPNSDIDPANMVHASAGWRK